ncbi:MAG: cytochrome c [Actinomycetota bacterium]|nr:cytochrome c [Actinomycetota bacterium]
MRTTNHTSRFFLFLASIGLAVFALSGCGTSSSAPINGDFQDRGRQLFNAKCGTCHVMKAAASVGTQGPNLDTAFAPSREAGMDEDTVRGIVKAQIHRPYPSDENFPGISMPADLVTGNDAEDVAAYVARYAGVKGAKPPEAPGEGPGAQVYANNGCGSCHIFAAAESAGVLGPDLDQAIPGMTRAEVERAILEPDAEKPKGYEDVAMPDRFDSIPKSQLDQLIEFLMTQAAAGDQS